MARKRVPQPTDGELAILRVLWSRGPSTVHDLLVELGRESPEGVPPGYTTVLKLLQIMVQKGLATQSATGRRHVFAAAESQQKTQDRMAGRFLDMVFDGSPSRLLQGLLAAKRVSNEELDAVRRLLDEHERGGK